MEWYYIKMYGCISPDGYNLRSGGSRDGASEETKKRLSAINLGRKHPPRSLEWRKNLSNALKGRRLSEGDKKKFFEVTNTPEARAKRVAFHTGRKRSKENCEKIRISQINRKPIIRSKEWAKNISLALSGKKRSPQHCMNLSIAQKK